MEKDSCKCFLYKQHLLNVPRCIHMFTCIFVIVAIKNALKQENLNPEIEEKLLQLQRYQEKQMKGGVENSVTSNQTHHNSSAATTPRPPSRKRPAPSSNIPAAAATTTTTPTNMQSSSSGGDDRDDKEWIETPRKRPALKQENRDTTPK